MKRIHTFGASGSGTTTLAEALAQAFDCRHFDTDNYYWLPTVPPFTQVRESGERQRLLFQDLKANESWVLSGSLCGWGDFAIPLFDAVVFVWVPPAVRMQRLRDREIQRYGPEIEEPNHPQYEAHNRFLEWASQYDAGGLDMRSKAMHEQWIATLPCPVFRVEGTASVEENLRAVINQLSKT